MPDHQEEKFLQDKIVELTSILNEIYKLVPINTLNTLYNELPKFKEFVEEQTKVEEDWYTKYRAKYILALINKK